MYKTFRHRIIIRIKSSSKWREFLSNESESLQSMIIKIQFHQCFPHWMQNQTFKNERVFRNNAFTNKFCWDILLHVHERSENKVEKDKKNCLSFTKF